MSQHNFKTLACALEGKIVTLHAFVAIGASGAPTLQKWNKQATPAVLAAASSAGYGGIKSITRSSAGKYVLVLDDRYVGLLAFWGGFQNDTAPAALQIANNATGTNVQSATSPQITFTCYNGSGVATDPANGELMFLEIALLDSMAA